MQSEIRKKMQSGFHAGQKLFHVTPFWHFFANFIWKKQKNLPKRAWIIKNKNKKRYPKNLVKELSWARFFFMEKKTEKKKKPEKQRVSERHFAKKMPNPAVFKWIGKTGGKKNKKRIVWIFREKEKKENAKWDSQKNAKWVSRRT